MGGKVEELWRIGFVEKMSSDDDDNDDDNVTDNDDGGSEWQ